MKTLILSFSFALMFYGSIAAQAPVPLTTLVRIVKAEDARAYGPQIEDLLRSPNSNVRERAALAAGRIGDDRAIEPLAKMFGDKRNAGRVWTMAVFAIGEIESVKGSEHVILVIKSESGYVKRDAALLSRAFEAAGKIAAANPKDPAAKELGEVILKGLEMEQNSASPSFEVIWRGVTAVMRARPADGDKAIRPFLAHSDPEVVADTLNALTRLRSKNANRDARDLLETSVHALIRANAARLLGAAEDKDALDLLLKAATTDTDSRVRVSAIRSVGSLKDAGSADKLIARGEELARTWERSKGGNPAAKNEMLEIATVLGRLLAGTHNQRADALLKSFIDLDRDYSTEFAVAWVRVTPLRIHDFQAVMQAKGITKVSKLGFMYQAMTEASTSTDSAAPAIKAKMIANLETEISQNFNLGITDLIADGMQAYAKLKPEGADKYLMRAIEYPDLFVRASAAGLMADRPRSGENIEALKKAFAAALIQDKRYNDAQMAILDALFKLDKKEAVGTLLVALSAPDHLVRKKAFNLLADKDLQKGFPGIPASLENARSKHKDQVLPYSPAFGTKLGQVLNTDADYRRALGRKNGGVRAVLTTEKGAFTIVFDPEEAPLTVDNWVKLARAGYFNGLEVHRVVPNFVMQDGDPRGDGNGGPGWSIRCEINMLLFDRGAVGMALSGKDTGGSQWFVDHSPQPHLDGGYTVFGHVDEPGMKVVDQIVRGDKILNVKIVETASMPGPVRRK